MWLSTRNGREPIFSINLRTTGQYFVPHTGECTARMFSGPEIESPLKPTADSSADTWPPSAHTSTSASFTPKLAGNGGDAECIRAVEKELCRPPDPKPVLALELNALPVRRAANVVDAVHLLRQQRGLSRLQRRSSGVEQRFLKRQQLVGGRGRDDGPERPGQCSHGNGLRACAAAPARRAASRPSWQSRTAPRAGQTRRHKTPTAESPPRPLRG